MADPIRMMITAAGLDALVDAQSGATDAVQIAQVGLTQSAFVMAPTITSLPGEFKRISAVSGQSVSETVIHMTAQDNSEDIYDLRGLGLFLPNGSLFAVYSQETPIFRKVSIAFFLLALDIAFSNGAAGDIVFGDTSFLMPPATETVKGVARIADPALAEAGADHDTIITPLTLRQRLDALALALTATINALSESTDADLNSLADGFNAIIAALVARTITGTGLVTGGGDLTQSRTVDVRAAIGAEAIAGTATDCALTPAALRAVQAALTVGGTGLVTGGGDLTQSRTVDVRAATGAEAIAGTATDCALTPAALRAVQAALTIGGSGLVTGGGDLTQSRTVDVRAATGAEAIAGTASDCALTPAALRAVQAALTLGGTGLVTGGGDLTQSRTVDVRAASGAEAIAGTATDCALTPAALRAVQAALTITGSGLVTGGGDLTQGRALHVEAASVAETAEGALASKAVTPASLIGALTQLGGWQSSVPLFRIPGTPIIVQAGTMRATVTTELAAPMVFPVAFPNACIWVGPITYLSADSNVRDLFVQMRERTTTGFNVFFQAGDSADNRADGFDWIAIGY
ncbi:gp53-like domain-containing protein [Sphingobium abikonense]|uniref:gp53-like domain-containing protein n=1 Tax=Sphingobium abikonense TaxID=86193 RepID=UPI000787D650|nr:hypothetical protein [Sphingobium abikonense]